MDPKVWGPHFWFVLHLVSFNYPDKPSTFQKEAYAAFYHSVKDILPCPTCRQHYQNYLSQYPIQPHIDERLHLVKWVIQIHNFVNNKLGKPVYTDDEVFQIYANLDPISPFQKVNLQRIENEKKINNFARHYIFIALGIAIICYLVYVSNKYYYYLT